MNLGTDNNSGSNPLPLVGQRFNCEQVGKDSAPFSKDARNIIIGSESMLPGKHILAYLCETVSFFRPLARRRERVLRPPFVAMCAKKP